MQTVMKEKELILGNTYWVCLEQDWYTCTLEYFDDDQVVVNWHGRLWSYGIQQYFDIYEIDHFKLAWGPAPDGHWSRKYYEKE